MRAVILSLAIASGVAGSVSAQSAPLSASDIAAAIVGKRVQSRIVMVEITASYGRDGRYSYAHGSGGSTVVVRGAYQISDGKVCHQPDDRSRGGGCQKVTREDGTYYFTDDRGEKRRVTIFD